MKHLQRLMAIVVVCAGLVWASLRWFESDALMPITPVLAKQLTSASEGPPLLPPPPPLLSSAEMSVEEAVEARREQHRALLGGDLHNACIGLIYVGDQTSIPLLIEALKEFPDEEPRGSVICTWGHCVEALETITQAKPGYSYSAWHRWRGGEEALPNKGMQRMGAKGPRGLPPPRK
jgi:hypothetical protein